MEIVSTPEKSTLKYGTFNLNYETLENPHLLPTSVNTKGKISRTLLLVRIKNFDHYSLHGTLITPEAPLPSPVHYSIFNYILTY